MVGGVDLISLMGKSHHSEVSFVFQCYAIRNSSDVVKSAYSKGKYDQLRNNLRHVNWDGELMGKGTDEAFLSIKSMIDDDVFNCIPLYKQKKGCRSKPAWMNKTALSSIKIK